MSNAQRMPGREAREVGFFTRLLYWYVKRKVAKVTGTAVVPEPVKLLAHHPRLLLAYGQMELGIAVARRVPEGLKTLASIKAATLIGCPH